MSSKASNRRSEDDQVERITGIFAEQMQDYFVAVTESLDDIRNKTDRIPFIENRLDTIEGDLKVIKRSLKDHSGELRDHDQRINKLEATVFHA